jgi:hypothetical protein
MGFAAGSRTLKSFATCRENLSFPMLESNAAVDKSSTPVLPRTVAR